MESYLIDKELQLLKRIKNEGLTPEVIVEFNHQLVSYYYEHGRDLPWRKTTNPYHILVSEIMLQQTQVERVKDKFEEFIRAFPDFLSLANASVKEVLSIWQGMGYNRRALALKQVAQRVMDECNGSLPQDVKTLITFPGIGEATASAILVYAFNIPVAYIETNVRRVFIHFFFGERKGIRDDEIKPLVMQALPKVNSREWYNSLMDYGAELKKRGQNPNRKSASFAKQSQFKGSDRQMRGLILREVLTEVSIDTRDLLQKMKISKRQLHRILRALEDEGFIMQFGDKVKIAE